MSDDKAFKDLLPLTESTYYILLSLKEPRHGYSIMQNIEAITRGRIKMGPGTLYGALSKMESQGIIKMVSEEDKRKSYQLTAKGIRLLGLEIKRLEELYRNGIKYGV